MDGKDGPFFRMDRKQNRHRDRLLLALIASIALVAPFTFTLFPTTHVLFPAVSLIPGLPFAKKLSGDVRAAWEEDLLKCERLHVLPGPPADFSSRPESDRFVNGTLPVLIKNATVWTGEDDGYEVLNGADVLLDRGIIQRVSTSSIDAKELPSDVVVHDANGAWLTPSIFDVHSHIGVESSPYLSGAGDVNSVQNPILPYLRSLDSLNTHDASYHRSLSGGVTASLILPGSANNIGGQAFVIKLRDTKEKTPDSKVLEMPYHIPSPEQVPWKVGDPPRWRHMKFACGENIRSVYKQVRMDLAWNFRAAFEEARKLKLKQDDYCTRALSAKARGSVIEGGERFPDDLQWEALVDVLRGKVKVNTHCYEATDFAALVRHSNEFQFPIAAFHHAHEAYLVPDLLKTAWNNTPAIAIFATNARYKREAYRGTEYNAKILSENNITVLFKSDHPVLDSRYLLFEAQQGHHFGLPENLALQAITTKSAQIAGFGHRLGLVRKSFDADVVLWDSHPLSLGATPLQVWSDGIPQLDHPFPAKPVVVGSGAPEPAQPPTNPITLRDDFEEERREWSPSSSFIFGESQPSVVEEVLFTNVSEVLLTGAYSDKGVTELSKDLEKPFQVRVRNGVFDCIATSCSSASSDKTEDVFTVNLEGGSILPPLVAYGPALGLTEIIAEKSTTDAPVYDPLLTGDLSRAQQQWGPETSVRAVDGLELDGKHLRITKEAGLTKAITAPLGDGFFRGLSVAFRVDAKNVLEEGAVIKDVVALHVTLGHFKLQQRASVSTQIGELRRLLLGKPNHYHSASSSPDDDELKKDYFAMAGRGEIPLVVNAWKADTIATVIRLKKEIEETSLKPLNWIIHGGQEAHLVADELAEAGISVILSPPRAFPESWDERRALPGPPLSKRSAASVLHNAGVNLALGVPEEWQARTLLWEAAWAQKDSNAEITRADAIGWLSSNLEDMFELPKPIAVDSPQEFVAFQRDPFEFGSRPVAMSSINGRAVDLLF